MQHHNQSLNERARKLAIQSLKEQAKQKSKPAAKTLQPQDVRAKVLQKNPGPRLSDDAAKYLAQAIKSMLSGS
jgi:hypothetical protein